MDLAHLDSLSPKIVSLDTIIYRTTRRHPEVLAALGGEPRRMGHVPAAILRDAAQARGSSG
jgi:hypothetical protein